jgi:hypothetical protein
MESDMTPFEHDRQQSLDLASETLLEVKEATRESDQTELYEFACLLSQIVDLCADIDADQELETFVRDGLDEIQAVVTSDQAYSDRLESLRGEAIDRWGEVLSPLEDGDILDSAHEAGGWDDQGAQGHSEENQDEVIAPSAAEISTLLGHLGQPTSTENSDTKPITSDDAVTETGDVPAINNDSEPSDLPASENATAATESVHGEKTQDVEHEPLPTIETSDAATSIASLDPELREAFLDDASSCIC